MTFSDGIGADIQKLGHRYGDILEAAAWVQEVMQTVFLAAAWVQEVMQTVFLAAARVQEVMQTVFLAAARVQEVMQTVFLAAAWAQEQKKRPEGPFLSCRSTVQPFFIS